VRNKKKKLLSFITRNSVLTLGWVGSDAPGEKRGGRISLSIQAKKKGESTSPFYGKKLMNDVEGRGTCYTNDSKKGKRSASFCNSQFLKERSCHPASTTGEGGGQVSKTRLEERKKGKCIRPYQLRDERLF